jgi:predicted RNA polymerase sigma factor
VALVESALSSRRFGPYSLQAAISAVHAEAPRLPRPTGRRSWRSTTCSSASTPRR